MPRKQVPNGYASSRAEHLLHQKNGGPLLRWYDSAKRDLPWRRTSDPYAIWVSEIMLQQTQVATVIPYWERWMARFPTVEHLAKADEQDVLELWQGLGYYRRCRLLLDGAKFVATHGIPQSATDWLAVPGVGRYTAGAIASIAQSLPAALVDGNVERVYARVTGDRAFGPALTKNAWEWAHYQLFKDRPGDWNQALMELGATICKPTKPDCPICPLRDQCVARQSWTVDELPTQSPKQETVKLRHVVWIPQFEDSFGVRQIPAGTWWEGMWEFPRIQTDETGEVAELRDLVGDGWLQELGQIRHSVTKHRITVDVSYVRCESKSPLLTWCSLEQLATLPMPAPQRKILSIAKKTI